MYCEKKKLKSGQVRWECMEDGPPNPATGKRKQIKRRAKTQREAKQRVQKAIQSLQDDGIDERLGARMLFEDAAKHWLSVYSMTGVKRNTVRIREKEIAILNRYIAKTPIGNVTPAMYQKILNDLSPSYARTTVQGVNTSAGMIFRQAMKDKIIKENPTEHVVVPKKRQTVEDIEIEEVMEKYLEHNELEEFLNAVRQYGLDLDIERFYLLAYSGMRSGEACALKWSDISFEDNTIRITKTLYNENNNMKKYEITPPKTKGSIRTIHMEPEIMNLLHLHKKRQMKIKLKVGHLLEDYHDADFVFCRENGYPFAPSNILKRMDRLLTKTSIDKHATPHIFRHTMISMMAEAKIDVATIMERVGHEDINTTMKIYTHVTNKMKEDASDKVRNLYGNALEKINLN
ncbi:site-specific integrase [Thalassobacillus sp. CUG 92003]|uniref:tyrosine-type recombinase/integrase n=1 Tax=Thalassobacillus sp. CUG 92003 TaxID=2736641 RepID=UPI0015E76376|nr:site-specific integrase [Thalassobacillus sp. CUG 92003]